MIVSCDAKRHSALLCRCPELRIRAGIWYEYIRVWFLKLSCLTERPMEGPPLRLGVSYFLQRKTNKENQRMRSRCVWTSVFATNLSYRGYPTQGSISPDLPRSVCFVLINSNSKSFNKRSTILLFSTRFTKHVPRFKFHWTCRTSTRWTQCHSPSATSWHCMVHIGISSQFLTFLYRSQIYTYLSLPFYTFLDLLVFLDLLSHPKVGSRILSCEKGGKIWENISENYRKLLSWMTRSPWCRGFAIFAFKQPTYRQVIKFRNAWDGVALPGPRPLGPNPAAVNQLIVTPITMNYIDNLQLQWITMTIYHLHPLASTCYISKLLNKHE